MNWIPFSSSDDAFTSEDQRWELVCERGIYGPKSWYLYDMQTSHDKYAFPNKEAAFDKVKELEG